MKIASIVLVILGCGLLLWLCTYSPKAAAIAPAVKAALSRDITQAPQISTNSTAKDIHGFIQYFKRKGYIVSKSEAVYGAGGTLKSFAFRAAYPGAHATVEARVKEVRKGIFTAGGLHPLM